MNVQHFRLLFYFVEVAKAGSIRGAASRLGLSASVVSASLSGLEDVLGVSLLRRSTRHMELTPDGLKYLEKAVIAIDAFADVFEDLNTPAQETEGRVSISLPTELAAVWVPTVIAQFKKEFPKIEVLVHADDAKINVKTSEHDIAVRTEFRKSPRLGKNGIAVYPLELVCAPSYREALTGSLRRDLACVGFIGSDHQLKDSHLYCVENQALRETPLPVCPELTINNRQVALDLVRRGHGSALLLSVSVKAELERGTLIRMNTRYSFGFVVARLIALDKKPSRATKFFLDFLAGNGALENKDNPG